MIFRSLAVGVAFFLVLIGPYVLAANFADPTKANVLRQYDAKATQLVVPAGADNDGAGDSFWWFDAGAGVQRTNTLTLPNAVRVGSYSAAFREGGYYPAHFLLEGMVQGVWTALVDVAGAQTLSGSFPGGSQTVTQVRYTVTGPDAAAQVSWVGVREFQVFGAPGETIRQDSGVSFMRDAGKVVASSSSADKAGVWYHFTSGSAASAMDGDYFSHFHSQDPAGTTRAYASYTLDSLTKMAVCHVGWYDGQSTRKWEVYTSDAATIPPTQALATNDTAAIVAAGWTLQGSGAFNQEKAFALAIPGKYKHILYVWDSYNGSGALVEIEMYGVPPPKGTFVLLH